VLANKLKGQEKRETMSLFTIEKKRGKDVLIMEISRQTVIKLNNMKKQSKDPKKYVNEVKRIVNGEMDLQLVKLI